MKTAKFKTYRHLKLILDRFTEEQLDARVFVEGKQDLILREVDGKIEFCALRSYLSEKQEETVKELTSVQPMGGCLDDVKTLINYELEGLSNRGLGDLSNKKDQNMKVEAVKCNACGRLHEVTDETYYTVYGNITVGESGGLVGNNLDEEDRVTKSVAYCKPDCLAKALGIELKHTRQFEL
jgi:hypothetical protein